MHRTLRLLTALALFALIAILGGGCSNAPAGSGSGAGTNAASIHEQGMKFAACMRANGVSNFPDPSASGAFTIDAVVNGSSIDTNSAAWQKAISACKDLEPAGFMGSRRTPQQQAAAVKFAQCIRANGVPDFPDPAPDAPLIDTKLIPSTATDSGMSALHAAMQKCRSMAAAAGVTGGR